MTEPTPHPKQRPNILKQDAAETAVLLNLSDGQYYALNEVSARVWTLCDGTHTAAAIAAAIASEYDAPAEEIEADVREVLKEFADANLVEGAH